MKGIYVGAVTAVFLCMVLFPLLSMKKTVLPDVSSNGQVTPGDSDEVFVLKTTKDNKLITLSAFDYVCGVVGAEVPAEYEPEALKAQAVAAYTFALYRKEQNKSKEFDITDSTTSDQAFISDSDAKTEWGGNYTKYKEKIQSAVKEVLGEKILYDGKIILAVYHNISSGRTESAEAIWGGSYPYLVSVESVGDMLYPEYLSEVKLSADQLRNALKSFNIEFSENASEWFKEKKTTDSGSVLSFMVSGTKINGTDLRNVLNLKSANFDVAFSDGQFTFSVRGHGHGVGMSQYGAQFMAKQGSTYKEILNWYYSDCNLFKP